MKNRDLKLGDLSGDEGVDGGLDFGDFFEDCPLPHNPTAVVSFVVTDFIATHVLNCTKCSSNVCFFHGFINRIT